MVTITIIAIQIGCLIIGRTPVPVVLQLSQLNKREAECRYAKHRSLLPLGTPIFIPAIPAHQKLTFQAYCWNRPPSKAHGGPEGASCYNGFVSRSWIGEIPIGQWAQGVRNQTTRSHLPSKLAPRKSIFKVCGKPINKTSTNMPAARTVIAHLIIELGATKIALPHWAL
jgi:hypothetical protein